MTDHHFQNFGSENLRECNLVGQFLGFGGGPLNKNDFNDFFLNSI